MNISFSPADEVFRDEVRAFFQREYPTDLLAKAARGDALDKSDLQRAERALARKGWLCVNWPRDHGGPGWSSNQKYIFDEELERSGAPNVVPMGVIYVGPVIFTFGNDAQRQQWLPGIRESSTFWAQGYSEPQSGSDLASLQCSARRDGDDYVINGEKIWTSLAQFADWIFILARTSQEERKQQGITFLCLPMDSPGITVHPIITIDGRHSLNRVTFDSVRVPTSHRISEEGKGWHYANYLLGNERTSYAHVAAKRVQLAAIRQLAAADPELASDPDFHHDLVDLEVRLDALEITVLRVLSAVADGDAPGLESSILKVLATELAQDITELNMKTHGLRAFNLFAEDAPYPAAAKATVGYLGTRAQSIYGGSNEIQKNIIAKRVLGL